MILRQQVVINVFDNNGNKEIKVVSKDHQQRVMETMHLVPSKNSTEVSGIKELLKEISSLPL